MAGATVGAVATTAGVTTFDRAENGPAGTGALVFTACTLNWYDVPLTRPVTSSWDAAGPAVRSAPTRRPVPALTTSTLKLVIPPALPTGAVQRTRADALRGSAIPMTGAPGVTTEIVWSEKRSRSMLVSVSMPSTAVPPVWLTITAPSARKVTV